MGISPSLFISNFMFMKKLYLVLFVTMGCTGFSFGQTPSSEALYETAKGFMKTGDYDNAILVLNRAIAQEPNNKNMQKDLMFASYLKRDFAKAKEMGEVITKRLDADVQTYQMLGLTYKAIADYKEAEKLYKAGLKKFPNEGILYSDYGEMLADKTLEEAIKIWEKGLEADPNHSTNYYYIAKQYANRGETLWSILYGEIFLNLESFTARSTEIKNMMLDQYKKFFTTAVEGTYGIKKSNEFTKAVAEVLNAEQSQAAFGITPETLTAIRTRFILGWFDKYADRFPFRLFDHQRQLLQEGLFDAYNQWLFGPPANIASYQLWQKYHSDDYNNYLAFVRGRVFKIPEGQQYRVF
jgi:tetratricopeptide (TPR) repeat protein